MHLTEGGSRGALTFPPVTAGPVPVFKVRLHDTIETIAPAWRRLEDDGVLSAYQRLDWIRQILTHVVAPTSASPLFVEVMDEASASTVMIVPLALIRRGGYRMITWFDFGLCDYAAPLVAEHARFTPESMAAAWACVMAALPRADLIRISRIPEFVNGHPNPLASLGGRRRMAMQASGVAIDGDAQTLLQRLCRPSSLRDMDKQRRRLVRAGQVQFACAETADDVETLFSVLVAQRRRRFSELGRFDLLARPDIEAFYRSAALEGLTGGSARLFGLSVGATCIATAYGLVHGGTFHGILLTASTDPDWRKASPGLQIVADCMRWARSQDLSYFDFTVGDLPYKRDFGTETRGLDELVGPLTLKGRAVLAAERTTEYAMDWLRQHPAVYRTGQDLRRNLRKLGQRKAGMVEAHPSRIASIFELPQGDTTRSHEAVIEPAPLMPAARTYAMTLADPG